jgi:ubiquinone/menaquinone biosynthesis C-methylase UbiE
MMIDFDAEAKNWDTHPIRIERARAVAEGIRAGIALTPHMRALEYGCGTGLLSFALRPYLGHITLADSSAGMLEVLKEKIASSRVQNMTPLRLDLVTDPLPQEKYDLIYTLMVLHHVLDTDGLLRDFYRLLDAPGHLCIADLDEEDGSFHGPDFPGHRGFDRKELSERVEQAGFQAIRFSTIFRTLKEVDGQRREFPLFLMLAEKR